MKTSGNQAAATITQYGAIPEMLPTDNTNPKVKGSEQEISQDIDSGQNQSASGWDNDSPKFGRALLALCACSLANALVIVNVFPYSGYMTLYLWPSLGTPEAAAVYAGWLASAFMAGRLITAYWWGIVADRWGRRLVLQWSMIGSIVGCIVFGMASSYHGALLGRCLLGMVNAVTSTSKTVASELGQGNSQKERQAMGLVVGMRSWGFLLGPAIGGLLAEPSLQYPSTTSLYHRIVPPRVQDILEKFPFLLPNVVVALACAVSWVLSTLWLPETLHSQSEFRSGPESCSSNSKVPESRALLWKEQGENSKPQFATPNNNGNSSNPFEMLLNASSQTRHCILFYCLVSFHVTMLDEAFPLFAISTVGGLGMDEVSVGAILSFAGLIFAVFQYAVYSWLSNNYGNHNTISISCVFGLVPALFIPISVLLKNYGKGQEDSTGWTDSGTSIFLFLSCLLGGSKIMVCACFASLALETNQTVPSSQRAKLNAVLLMGGSLAKLVAPATAGWLVSASVAPHSTTTGGNFFLIPPPEWGSLILFGTIGFLGGLISGYSLWLPRHLDESRNRNG